MKSLAIVVAPIFLTLTLVLAHPSTGSAQPLRFEQSWRWTTFGTRHGLPANQVFDVLRLDGGTVWASTARGLAWYDGYRWSPVETGSGASPSIRALALKAFGPDSVAVVVGRRLLLGSTDGLSDVTELPSDPAGAFGGMAVLPDRTILLQLYPRVMAWTRGRLLAYEELPADLDADTVQFWQTRHGAWLTDANHLYALREGRWVPQSGWYQGEGRSVRLLTDNGAGTAVWYVKGSGTRAGLWIARENEEVRRVAPPIRNEELAGLDVGPSGEVLYFGSAGTLVTVTPAGDAAVTEMSMPPFRVVEQAYFDSDGGLWIATRLGLMHLSAAPDPWGRIAFPGEDRRNRVNEIVRTPDRALWLGTEDGLVVALTDGDMQWIPSLLGEPLGTVTGLTLDGEGRIWVASGQAGGGVYRKDPSGWVHLGVESGLTAPRIHRLTTDREGRVWVLGLDSDFPIHRRDWREGPGAFVFNGKRFESWGIEQGLPSGRVYAFTEGPDGAYWFGTLLGLSRFQHGTWTHWNSENGLRSDQIFTLAADGEGVLWFSDRNTGIGRVRDETVDYMDGANSLPSEEIWQIQNGPDGRLWFSSRGGFGVIDDQDAYVITPAEGLINTSLWPILPEEGRVLLGTASGLLSYDLRLAHYPVPQVYAQNPNVATTGTRISWQAFSFMGDLEPGRIRTRYRMDEGAWSSWSTVRDAFFPRLPAGDHTFQVQAVGFLGESADSNTASVPIVIPRPFLLRPSVALPIGLLVVLLTAMGIATNRRTRAYRSSIEQSAVQYFNLFRQANDAILIIDPVGEVILEANDRAQELYGIQRADLLGRSLKEFTVDVLRGERQVARIMETGNVTNFESVHRSADGSEHALLLSASLQQYEGQEALLVLARDMTELYETQAQLRQSQKLEVLGQFAGGIAHDFNNVLTVILGKLDMMDIAIPEDAPERKHLLEIRKAAEHAAQLTRQILAFARKELTRPEVVVADARIEELSRLLHRVIGEDIHLELRLEAGEDCVSIDPGQLEQVLTNLLLNARDSMPEGGTLSVRSRRSAMPEELREMFPDAPGGEFIRITVRDTGHGMDSAVLEHIFEPFYTTKGTRGSGLGLATVHGIVSQNRGAIAVHSRTGSGTTFDVYFPHYSGTRRDEAEQLQADAIADRREHVLLVEDEVPVRSMVQEILTSTGCRVTAHETPIAALAWSHEHRGAVDLLLTDVVMPEMNGFELAQQLIATQPQARVLFMTGYMDEKLPEMHIRKGNVMLIKKPFHVGDLVTAVKEAMEGARLAQLDAGEDGVS